VPLAQMNRNPRTLRSLGALLAAGERFVLMDVGARGGVSAQWQPIADLARVIGFEPDQVECDRLNAAGTGMEFHPCALHSSPGEHVFYLTESEFCHGFRPCDPKYFDRFPNAVNNRVRGEVRMRADSLDNFAHSARLEHIDFIKIDTEGSELDILQGGRGSLHAKQVLGLLVEVWWDPRLKNQPSFSEMDTFIRRQGFTLFDLECQRYPRNSLPVGRITRAWRSPRRPRFVRRIADALSHATPYRHHGQILTGDALYFRDPVWDLRERTSAFDWNDDTILRLVGLLDLYGYPDFAIEILDFYRDRFARPVNVDGLIDALVPPIDGALSMERLCAFAARAWQRIVPKKDGKVLPFDEYWRRSERLFLDNCLTPELRPKAHIRKPRYRGSRDS
jgi:FkbM family methyltransferase